MRDCDDHKPAFALDAGTGPETSMEWIDVSSDAPISAGDYSDLLFDGAKPADRVSVARRAHAEARHEPLAMSAVFQRLGALSSKAQGTSRTSVLVRDDPGALSDGVHRAPGSEGNERRAVDPASLAALWGHRRQDQLAWRRDALAIPVRFRNERENPPGMNAPGSHRFPCGLARKNRRERYSDRLG